MSLFGAQSIFATAASTEEALERAKELKSNMELAKKPSTPKETLDDEAPFKEAALAKKDELSGLFGKIRPCVRAFLERQRAFSMISEPLFSYECDEQLSDIEALRTLFKSARDLLASIVFDLRSFHEEELRNFHGDKYQCSGPDEIVRSWEISFFSAASVSSQRTRLLRPPPPQQCSVPTDDLSISAWNLNNAFSDAENVLRKSSTVWSFPFEPAASSKSGRSLSDQQQGQYSFEKEMVSVAHSLWKVERLACDSIDRGEVVELLSEEICGRIRDAGARYQDLVRQFRQVISHDEELLLTTKNAFEADLLLARKCLARTWRKVCETHKFPPWTRVSESCDVACMIFSGRDLPGAEAPHNLDPSEAADAFQNVLADIVPRLDALRGQFEDLLGSEDSFGAQSSPNESDDLSDLEQEVVLVATQLRRLERLSDTMDALVLSIVVTAPNGEIICERDATLYASSGTKLTIGALTNTIRDDIEVSLKKFVSIRDANPVTLARLGLQNVQGAIRGASLPLDSTYSVPSDVGRAGLIKLGFLPNSKMFISTPDTYNRFARGRRLSYYENVVFAEAVRSDIGPGKLSLICQMEQRSDVLGGVNGITVVASIVFFSETVEQFYQLPLKCDNISRSSEQNDTLLHTIPASSCLIGGEGGGNAKVVWSSAKANGTAVPSALSSPMGDQSSDIANGSGIFSKSVPKNSKIFGGAFGKSSVTPPSPTRFQFSDEGRCAAAYSAIEAFLDKTEAARRTSAAGSNDSDRYDTSMPLYVLEQVGEFEDLRWDYPLITAITRGRVTEALIHHIMETSAELPKIGEFLKSFITDTIDLGRIKIVPYGADDLFDDETAVLDVLRQQDRDDMEWEVRGFPFSSRNARAHSAE